MPDRCDGIAAALRGPRIILVNTSHPGNIGASARAMKNMGLERLGLVQPKIFPSAEATARASGADDLLARAQVFSSLDDALIDCTLVLGASARCRTLPVPMLDPRACGRLIAEQAELEGIALLFGHERTGLTNAEIDRCHHLVQIPANPDYPSLNIAAAVQVIAYELRMAFLERGTEPAVVESVDYATDGQMEHFYEHLEKTLIALDFLNPAQPRQLMRRLRRLFGRARLDQNELNILRGILTAVGRKKHRHRSEL